jgi:AcrR family transcriptional regulator
MTETLLLRLDDVYTVYMRTQEAIVAAAWRRFEEGGEAELSLRRVAADVGLTPMAIYRHFASRQALLDTLVLEAVGEWRRCVAAVPPAAPDEWLRAIADAYLEFALRQPRKFEAAFLVRSPVALRYPADFLAGDSPALRLQLALVEEATASLGGDGGTALVTLIALAQGLVGLYRSGRLAEDEGRFRELYGRVMDRCIASLARAPAR